MKWPTIHIWRIPMEKMVVNFLTVLFWWFMGMNDFHSVSWWFSWIYPGSTAPKKCGKPLGKWSQRGHHFLLRGVVSKIECVYIIYVYILYIYTHITPHVNDILNRGNDNKLLDFGVYSIWNCFALSDPHHGISRHIFWHIFSHFT